jgi:hypothetical protein
MEAVSLSQGHRSKSRINRTSQSLPNPHLYLTGAEAAAKVQSVSRPRNSVTEWASPNKAHLTNHGRSCLLVPLAGLSPGPPQLRLEPFEARVTVKICLNRFQTRIH